MNNNKLIAEFMGVHQGEHTHFMVEPFALESYADVDDLKYDISWDWLMPVVEKIECTHDNKGDCFNVMMEAFECTISGLGLTLCLNGHTKMDATYKAVVEFIKTYNDEQ